MVGFVTVGPENKQEKKKAGRLNFIFIMGLNHISLQKSLVCASIIIIVISLFIVPQLL